MKPHPVLSNLRAQIAWLTLQKPLTVGANARYGLDEFVKIESYSENQVEYVTVHGCRVHSSASPELNMFVVLKKGNGFIPARGLPYVYKTSSPSWGKCPQLVVACSPTDAATQAGYARAVPLPYKYLPNPESTFPWLARDLTHIPTAMYSVYSKSVELPDMAYSDCCFTICLPNSLKVCINSQNEEATGVGYANAVPIPISKSNIYDRSLKRFWH